MAFMRLANEISAHCKILDNFIASENLPEPSLHNNGPLEFPITASTPQNIMSARTALLDATKTLHDLGAGPAAMLVWPALTHPYQLTTLRILQRFSIPEAVPVNQTESFSKIAAKIGLDEEFVTRIIKHASTYHIFSVDENSGTVSHTAASRALLEHPTVRDSLKICLDERFLATSNFPDRALLKYGTIGEPQKTAFNIAFDRNDDYLAFMRDPANLSELKAMQGFLGFVMSGSNMGARSHNMDLLAGDAIDWEALEDGLVVDMGGGYGHVCASIAKRHRNLQFIVQDLPTIVDGGRRAIRHTTNGNNAVASRISFMEHDFLTPQTVTNADVFMLRFVIHDWPDKYVIQILQNLVPAMKRSTRIVIMDYLLAGKSAVPKIVERLERTMDIAALSIIAGKERTLLDWKRLLKQMENKLQLIDVCADSFSAFGLVILGLA